jgi:hypothetical protein
MKKTNGTKPVGPRVVVNAMSLQRAAARLLTKAGKLVTPEISYLLQILGTRSTQEEIDENVVAVRKMPWHTFAPAD